MSFTPSSTTQKTTKQVIPTWLDPKEPGSYSALTGFLKNQKFAKRRDVEAKLSEFETFATHHIRRRTYPRPRVIVTLINQIWGGDLAVFEKYKHSNRGFAYLLVVVDLFSKMTYLQPVKNRQSKTIIEAFKIIFERTKQRPMYLWFDQATEIFSKSFLSFAKQEKFKVYNTFSKVKSAFSERKILDIKRKIEKHFAVTKRKNWVDIVAKLEHSFNHTWHSSIKMRPIDVTEENSDLVWDNLYKNLIMLDMKPPKFKINDIVSISNQRITFKKSYEQSFTTEKFKIIKVIKTVPIYSYKLEDLNSEPVQGSFNEHELIKR